MFFFFKQKTAYEMRISDWSSDVCSSDLGIVLADDPKGVRRKGLLRTHAQPARAAHGIPQQQRVRDCYGAELARPRRVACALRNQGPEGQIGSASCRERVCQYV